MSNPQCFFLPLTSFSVQFFAEYQASSTLDLKTMRKLSTNFIIVVLCKYASNKSLHLNNTEHSVTGHCLIHSVVFTTALAWTAFGFVTPSLQPYLYAEVVI